MPPDDMETLVTGEPLTSPNAGQPAIPANTNEAYTVVGSPPSPPLANGNDEFGEAIARQRPH
jgi:hypothetical protein